MEKLFTQSLKTNTHEIYITLPLYVFPTVTVLKKKQKPKPKNPPCLFIAYYFSTFSKFSTSSQLHHEILDQVTTILSLNNKINSHFVSDSMLTASP